MDRRRLLQLWRNAELKAFIEAQARRHFSGTADIECAVSEGWAAVEGCPPGTTMTDIQKSAYNRIRRLYRRHHGCRGTGPMAHNEPNDP